MEILKEALERNGFTYVGPCKICGGRGFEYVRNKAKAKIKKDLNGRELQITLNGFADNGRRIIDTLIRVKEPGHVENIDNIIQRELGLLNEQEETNS
jgi:hypothetical protein